MHAYGYNGGYGYTKLIGLSNGKKVVNVSFPSMIAPASRAVAGALERATTVTVSGSEYWVGLDAEMATHPLTDLSEGRLTHPALIPAMVKHATARISDAGTLVTGLPAHQAENEEHGRALVARLREASTLWEGDITVIAEPVGLLYSLLLDNHGKTTGDTALKGSVAVADIGHLTLDVSEVQKMRPVSTGMDARELGTAQPLKSIRSFLSAELGRELTLYQTDQAIRAGGVTIAGQFVKLPSGWDAPLYRHAETIVSYLTERWGNGKRYDAIVIGGGGAELPQLTAAIQTRYSHAVIVPEPQMAVARGYARLAARIAAQ
jgi:hypothetical protein